MVGIVGIVRRYVIRIDAHPEHGLYESRASPARLGLGSLMVSVEVAGRYRTRVSTPSQLRGLHAAGLAADQTEEVVVSRVATIRRRLPQRRQRCE